MYSVIEINRVSAKRIISIRTRRKPSKKLSSCFVYCLRVARLAYSEDRGSVFFPNVSYFLSLGANIFPSKLFRDTLNDGQSVSMFWCRAPPWAHYQSLLFPFFCRKIALLFVLGCPLWREDESVICSAICQWSKSWRTHNHTLPSHLRLLGSLTVASYDSQGLRWKYSNPPPHGVKRAFWRVSELVRRLLCFSCCKLLLLEAGNWCVCVRARARACVRAWVRACVFVCVCVCVCVWERERTV
jgi:hypothetical protein